MQKKSAHLCLKICCLASFLQFLQQNLPTKPLAPIIDACDCQITERRLDCHLLDCNMDLKLDGGLRQIGCDRRCELARLFEMQIAVFVRWSGMLVADVNLDWRSAVKLDFEG